VLLDEVLQRILLVICYWPVTRFIDWSLGLGSIRPGIDPCYWMKYYSAILLVICYCPVTRFFDWSLGLGSIRPGIDPCYWMKYYSAISLAISLMSACLS
jgi:hypothetical protein